LEPDHPPNPPSDLSATLLLREGACRLGGDFRPWYWCTEFGLGDLTPEFFFSPRKPIAYFICS
jgi:hypothetical protein